MRTYDILKMTDAGWEAIPTLEIDHKYFDTPEEIKAYAQISYDDEAILVHLSTVERVIRAVETGPLGSPCEDSCLEFFFCPEEGDPRYFNIEFNSNGCMYLGFGSGIADLVRILPGDGVDPFSYVIQKEEGRWEITYRVPFAFIRRFFPSFSVYAGKRMRANCYKCADFSEPPHYRAWSPIVGEPFKFHRPECFGEMIFN
ncbi:MAG: hypothetical protein E7643_00965 [Ruminococcaceae bacterium]|nr:hypothetical protein [Oscillospiraceae bacterium]